MYSKRRLICVILSALVMVSYNGANAMGLQEVAEQAAIDAGNSEGLSIVIAMDMNGQIIAQAEQGGDRSEYPLAFNHRSTPGAVFRPITVLAALSNDVLDPEERISDEGAFDQFNYESPLYCWIPQIDIQQHKDLTYIDALYHDCYFFCYSLGVRLGIKGKRLTDFADMIGMTSKIENEANSFVGNQQVLYDTALSLSDQETEIPLEVHSTLTEYLASIVSHNFQDVESCALALMQMAVHNETGYAYQDWEREIIYELSRTFSFEANGEELATIIEIIDLIKWDGTDVVEVANGQSPLVQCTPISIARVYTMLANGGFVYRNGTGSSHAIDDLSEIIGQYLPHIRRALQGNSVDEVPSFADLRVTLDWVAENGDDMSSVFQSADFSGKSSGEWYVCIAPYERPEVVVVAYTENCDDGSTISVADRFLKAYFAQ